MNTPARKVLRILLDENFPTSLRSEFRGHTVMTVADMGWKGRKDPEVYQLAVNAGFDVIVTADKRFLREVARACRAAGPVEPLPIPILKLDHPTTIHSLKQRMPQINAELDRLTSSPHAAREPERNGLRFPSLKLPTFPEPGSRRTRDRDIDFNR